LHPVGCFRNCITMHGFMYVKFTPTKYSYLPMLLIQNTKYTFPFIWLDMYKSISYLTDITMRLHSNCQQLMLFGKIFSVRFSSSFISALPFDTRVTVYKFSKNLGAKISCHEASSKPSNHSIRRNGVKLLTTALAPRVCTPLHQTIA